MRHPAASRQLAAAVLMVSLLGLGACETPVQGYGAVGNSLRSVDFEPPPGSETATGVPRPTVQGTAPGERPQSQLFFGQNPVPGAAAGAAEDTTGGVRLNFDGASVREVVDVVLGEILGASYTIDPAVSGEVILSSTAPLSKADMLTVLETILQMHGATLVDLGGTYAVMAGTPTVGASQFTTVGGGEAPPLIVGTGVTVVPLRYISAAAASQFIQPLLSLPEQIRIDDARNLLLFVGNAAERQNVVRTLGEIDVDWMAGRSVGIFPLSTATPEAVIAELDGLFSPFGGFEQSSSNVRFLPMDRLNAVLAITSQPEQLVEIERWVQRLDRGSGSSVQFFVYQLQHTPALPMAELLNASFADAAAAGIVPAAAKPAGEFGAAPPQAGLETGDFLGDEPPLPFDAPFSELPPSERRNLLESVKIVPNELSNTLVVRATPQAYALIEQTLRRLDVAPLQVLIEATIAEVVLNDQLRYGVQYFFQAGSFKGGFNTTTDGGVDGTVNPNLLEPLARVPGFNFVYSGASSNITIDALSRVTDVQVLSSPSLVVQDNSEAVLTVGDEVPLITRTSQGVDNPDSPIVANIEYRETGVILEVKPRINVNNIVSLQISQEVSRVQGTEDQFGNPTIAQRRITSSVNVTSGQTVVLGGLIQDDTVRGRDSVPGLGDIPVLGNLFGSTNDLSRRTELIVFITPRVIRNADDARVISEELRDRMRAAEPPRDEAGEPLTPAGAPPPVPVPEPTALPEPTPPPAPPTPAVSPRPLTTSRALPEPRPAAARAPTVGPALADGGDAGPAKGGDTAPAQASEVALAERAEVAATDVGKALPTQTGEIAPARMGRVVPAEGAKAAPAEEGGTAAAPAGASVPAKIDDVATAQTGRVMPAEIGDVATAQTGDVGQAEGGHSAAASAGAPAPAEIGDVVTAQTGRAVPAEIGDVATAQTGDVVQAEGGHSAAASAGAPAEIGDVVTAQTGRVVPAEGRRVVPAKNGDVAAARTRVAAPAEGRDTPPAATRDLAAAEDGNAAPAAGGDRAAAVGGEVEAEPDSGPRLLPAAFAEPPAGRPAVGTADTAPLVGDPAPVNMPLARPIPGDIVQPAPRPTESGIDL